MKKLYFLFSLLMATVIGLSSCESDDSLTNEPPAQEYIDKAKEILVGDLVLSTRATMSVREAAVGNIAQWGKP